MPSYHRSLLLRGLACFVIIWLIGMALTLSVASAQHSFGDAFVPLAALMTLFSLIVSGCLVSRLSPLQGNDRTHASASLRMEVPYEEAVTRVREALAVLATSGVRQLGDGTKFVARVATQGRGQFGDTITVVVHPRGAYTDVQISSRPRQPFLVFDYGRNEAILRSMIERLRAGDGSSSP